MNPAELHLSSRTVLFREPGPPLDEDALDAVERELTQHRLKPREALLTRGELVNAVTIVVAGVLEVSVGEPATLRHIGRIGPGECLGEVSLMLAAPSPADVCALTPVDTLQLTKEALLKLVGADPGLGRALEESVKRGVVWVERDAAARAAQPAVDQQSFLRHVSAFFRLRG